MALLYHISAVGGKKGLAEGAHSVAQDDTAVSPTATPTEKQQPLQKEDTSPIPNRSVSDSVSDFDKAFFPLPHYGISKAVSARPPRAFFFARYRRISIVPLVHSANLPFKVARHRFCGVSPFIVNDQFRALARPAVPSNTQTTKASYPDRQRAFSRSSHSSMPSEIP